MSAQPKNDIVKQRKIKDIFKLMTGKNIPVSLDFIVLTYDVIFA